MSANPAVINACRQTLNRSLRATGLDWSFRTRLLAASSGRALVTYHIMQRRFPYEEATI